jgi:hypothetical protein
VRELQLPGITPPGRADGERRGPLAWGELRDDGRLVGGQVGGVVGLDVADGAAAEPSQHAGTATGSNEA